VIHPVERLADFGFEHAGGTEAVIRGLGAIVDPLNLRVHTDPGDELLDRLEEVHIQVQRPIDGLKGRIGRLRREPIKADPPPHDGAVLLLDVGAVVLPVRAASGKGDALALAVASEGLVDELGAGIAIPTEQRHGQAGAMDRPAHALLPFPPDGLQLGPASDDVDRTERTEVEPERGGATVGDEIPF